jgi:hypothetical protein
MNHTLKALLGGLLLLAEMLAVGSCVAYFQ